MQRGADPGAADEGQRQQQLAAQDAGQQADADDEEKMIDADDRMADARQEALRRTCSAFFRP